MSSKLQPVRSQMRERCQADSGAAIATTAAVSVPTDPADPFRNDVRVGAAGTVLPTGLHPALGGPGDRPCPGDLLAAALVSCMESTILAVADLMEIPLRAVEVEARGRTDVGPALKLGAVGNQEDLGLRLWARVEAAPGTDAAAVEQLLARAERGSAVLQMLRGGVPVATDLEASKDR